MEILGSRIPGLQSAIASVVESVTAGIAETTKGVGVAALSVAQDSFSSEQMGTTSSANLPAVSEAAEYPAPDQYFKKFSDIKSDSPVSSLAISKTLSDPKFNVPESLQTFNQGRTDVLGDLYGEQQKAVAPFLDGFSYSAARRSPYEKSDAATLPNNSGYPVSDRFGRENAEGAGLGDVSYSASDRFGSEKFDGRYSNLDAYERRRERYFDRAYDQVQKLHASKQAKARQMDRSDVASLYDQGYPASDRFGRENSDAPSLGTASMWKPTPGTASMWKPTPPPEQRVGRENSEALGSALMQKPTPSAEQRFGRNKVEGTSAESVAAGENPLQTFSNKTGLFDDIFSATRGSVAITEEAAAQALQEEIDKNNGELEAKQEEFNAARAKKDSMLENLSYSATERYDRDKKAGSSLDNVLAGHSDGSSSRSIIVVGGKNDGSDRSIIVVGGKTPDTYLKTIDDSFNELRQAPTAQAADLFRHQATAIQNLFSTVDQVVQLQKNFASNLFGGSLLR
jgi:hypothetical protein